MCPRSFPQTIAVELGLDDPDHEAAVLALVARELGCAREELPTCRLLRRSLDARRGRVRFRLLYELNCDPELTPVGGQPLRDVELPARVVIVGGGPAGLFCAYELARHGIASRLVDRGKLVQPRRHDIAKLYRAGCVDPDSNYCFGEGGAGTFSDGKLYTRASKRGSVGDVLEILALHGAPPEILTDARPHIGSNRLPAVITRIRERLEAVGVGFEYGQRVVGMATVASGSRQRVRAVRLADGRELAADAVVLASGHSARDIYEMLSSSGVRLEAKGFAMGVRIEHPQPLINQAQYGRSAGHARLPNAAYRVATSVEGRGVFSFCMCPGGFVVPAATEANSVVLNGMSLAKRDAPYANAGLVVSIEPEDLMRAGFPGPLGGVQLQRQLEQMACRAGGGALRAPASRATDFLRRRASATVPRSSYRPGIVASDLTELLDSVGLGLAARLRGALARFSHGFRGFVSDEAVLIGVESRTSSPVRVPRDPQSLQSQDIVGVYPTGEGAGYAGGIVSAALDGVRVARSVRDQLGV